MTLMFGKENKSIKKWKKILREIVFLRLFHHKSIKENKA